MQGKFWEVLFLEKIRLKGSSSKSKFSFNFCMFCFNNNLSSMLFFPFFALLESSTKKTYLLKLKLNHVSPKLLFEN